MRAYVGAKIILAEPKMVGDKEGYRVVYPNPNGSMYESWSPKDVFENAYREVTLSEAYAIKGAIL